MVDKHPQKDSNIGARNFKWKVILLKDSSVLKLIPMMNRSGPLADAVNYFVAAKAFTLEPCKNYNQVPCGACMMSKIR